MASAECNMYTKDAWVWGLARRGERRWFCLVKFFMFIFKMFYMSAILFLLAIVGIPYIPPWIWWANVRQTMCTLYFCHQSFATWASKSAWQLRLYSLIMLTDDKPTNHQSHKLPSSYRVRSNWSAFGVPSLIRVYMVRAWFLLAEQLCTLSSNNGVLPPFRLWKSWINKKWLKFFLKQKSGSATRGLMRGLSEKNSWL